MPPYTATASPSHQLTSGHQSFESTYLHQHESSVARMVEKLAQQASPEWTSADLIPVNSSLESTSQATPSFRLDVKTHVFKKELQEYVTTRSDDRLRIETIIYVELSIVKQGDDSVVKNYDYMRLPKELFHAQPEKVMSPEDMAAKRILNVHASVLCPSDDWRVEKEACVRCARRMSAKLEENESRIMHMLPELYRAENGDALVNFRSGVANIQFKINCYCGHKKEKEGFVIRFDSQSDSTIASHVTSPLMFYHQNKNRIASRALAAAEKAQRKAEKLQQQQEYARARSAVKSISNKAKREPRRGKGGSPGRYHPFESATHPHHRDESQQQMPSPPDSLMSSPVEYSVSPQLHDYMDCSDRSFSARSPLEQDSMSPLFPELLEETQPQLQPQHEPQQQLSQPPVATVSHMTPHTGPTRGGTLVTIHGSGFTVGEMMYICFGETFIPIIPQHSHLVECFTPAWTKAETVAVFALHTTTLTNMPAQSTFTYVDDNEKELVKLALQRIMNISARMDGPLESVMQRAHELTMWSDILGTTSENAIDGSLALSDTRQHLTYTNLETMIMDSLKLLDSPHVKNVDGLSISNDTGHTMLHLSIALRFKDLAKDLVLRGIDTAAQDKNGLTALDLARLFKDRVMIDALASSMDIIDMTAKKLDSGPGLASLPMRELPMRDNPKFPGSFTGDHVVDPQAEFEWEGFADVERRSSASSAKNTKTGPMLEITEHERKPRSSDSTAVSIDPLLTDHHKQHQRDFLHSVMIADTVQGPLVMHPNDPSSSAHWMSVQMGDLPQDFGQATIIGQNHDRLLRRGGEIVEARRRSNDQDGGSFDAAEQAVVQSSRTDVESEPVLFLGGQPVVMLRRHTENALSNPPQESDSALAASSSVTTTTSAPSGDSDGIHEDHESTHV